MSLLLPLAGCSPRGQEEKVRFGRSSLNSELTPGTGSIQRLNEIVIAPVVTAPNVDPERKGQLNSALIEATQSYTDLRIVNLEDPARVERGLVPLRGAAISGVEFAQKLGVATNAQGVLLCEVNRFVEREGSKFGAGVSAAVGFSLRLIDIRSGKTVWRATYDRNDEPVTQNLLRLGEELKEGVAFQSAITLIKNGFVESAKALGEARRNPR